MALVGVVLVVAVALGFALRGSLGRLADLPMTGWPYVVLAAAAQALGGLVASWSGSTTVYAAGSIVATLLVVAFLAHNRRLVGVPLVAIGLFSNALVVALNGGMPVSLDAAARAGVRAGDIVAGLDPRHVVANAHTVLGFLGDVIAVPLPVHPEVLSIGDVLIAAGLGLLLVVAMTARPVPGADPESAPDRSLEAMRV